MLMIITSPAFANEQLMPSEFTCEGEGVNPPLNIAEVPPDAKSLMLIVDDPDAPTGLFTHWILWNIPPTVSFIDTDSVPAGAIEGENSLGDVGYTPPCPPTGVHHYVFHLFALSNSLSFKEGTDRVSVEDAMQQYIIDRAEIVGQYKKQNNFA